MVAALALVSRFQPAADAAPLTIGHIFGHVTAVTDPLNLVAGSIAVSDPVVASIRYDPAFGIDSDPGDPTHGAYGSPGWITFGINGLLF
jgi:hypothetical protein